MAVFADVIICNYQEGSITDTYKPSIEGYQDRIFALDEFIEQSLQEGDTQDLVRLNTYLRRYISPLATRDLFRREQLPVLLKQHKIDTITALMLDIRGFVNVTKTSGLDAVAHLLQIFFFRTIRCGFENYGLVGEFAGDRILMIFGFPPQSFLEPVGYEEMDEVTINVQRALNTAFTIQHVIENIKLDESFSSNLRKTFEVGMGISTGGPAWIGDMNIYNNQSSENLWRKELTTISKAANLASRAEDMTKDKKFVASDPTRKIIVDEKTVNQIKQFVNEDDYHAEDLGKINIRGLGEEVGMFHFIDLKPDVLPLTPKPITEKDRARVDWICKHIDGAIERAAARKIHLSLFDAMEYITSSGITPDEEAVFGQIITQIIHSFKAEKATLYQLDSNTGELVVTSSRGSSRLPSGTRIPAGAGISGWVASTKQAFISGNVHTNEFFISKYDPTVHSMMCVPLITNEKTIGVIQVMDNQFDKFQDSDLDSLKTFAGLATVALENAKKYDQEKRMIRARSIITETFSSALTLDEVLEAVMIAIKESLSVRNGTLYLIDHETGELIFEKFISESTKPPKLHQRLPAGTGIVGKVVAEKTSLLIPDTNDVTWHDRIGPEMRSMICVPLVARGQTVGAIQVLDQTPNFFNQQHKEILEWLSASAAIAVDNAVRLEQTQHKLVSSEAFAALGSISGKLAHNLKNHVTAIKVLANDSLDSDDLETFKENAEGIAVEADEALAEVNAVMKPIAGWEKTVVDINAVLLEWVNDEKETLKAMQHQNRLKTSITIDYQPFDQPLTVYAGEDQLKYIVRNIVDNAQRAIDDKGESHGYVTIKTSTENINENDWVIITIEDTGIGISPENINSIFEASFTTRPEGKVGGYGLFWVRLSVESIGGRINVSSEPNTGTEFRIRLPMIHVAMSA